MNAVTAPGTSLPGAASGHWLRDDRHAMFLGGMVGVLIVLMVVPDGFRYEELNTTVAPASGSAISRAIWLGLLGLGALILAWRAGLAWLLARCLNPYLLGFVGLAILSVAWSIEPSLTLRRSIRAITIVVVCAAFVVSCWHARRFQNVLRSVLTAVLLGSIVFGLVRPSLAIHQETSAELLGAWRGLSNHKNSLGALSCLGLIFWFHAWLSRERRLAPALAGGTIAAVCLVLSRSTTSLTSAVGVMLLLVMLLRCPWGLRRFRPLMVVALLVVLLTYTLAILQVLPGRGLLLSPVTSLIGKDMTLTGRTEIWAVLFDRIHLHPYIGTGYGAYWSGLGTGSPSEEFVRLSAFYPGSAHNGYLDVLIDLGAVGMACLIAYILFFVGQALRLMSSDPSQGALYLGLLFQQALTNLSESHWFSVLSVDFVIMTLATTGLARSLLEQRLRMCFGPPGIPVARAANGGA